MVKNFGRAVERVAPLKLINVRNCKEPWLEEDILKAEREKETELWKDWKSIEVIASKELWMRQKDKITILCAQAKSGMIRDRIDQNSNKSILFPLYTFSYSYLFYTQSCKLHFFIYSFNLF